MTVATLCIWMLVVYGVTTAITISKVAAPLRRRFVRWPWLHGFVHCPMCVGFWVGLVTSFVPSLRAWQPTMNPIANGFAGSAVCWIVHVAMVRMGSKEL